MIRILATLFLIVVHGTVMSQQLPLYTQYMFNPYMVNPSLVAASNRPEVNLYYRQQWTSIQNAPTTFQGDLQLPLSSKMGLGIQVVNDKTVLLNATSAMVTYGYRVNLATDHVLGFGLSAGIFANRIDLNDVAAADLQDPALLTAKNNNMAVDGQFGIHYRFRGFLLGASMVNIFDRKTLSPESFQKTELGQFKNNIIFASYRFTVVPEQFFFQPNVAYRLTSSNTNYYEASAIFSYKHIVDVGGGYRQDFGPTSMLRINIGNFQAGFAYDFPSPTAQVSTGGSREVQLKWRFGKEKQAPIISKKKEPAAAPPVDMTPTPKQEESTPPKQEEKLQEEVKKEPEPVVQQPVVTQQEPVRQPVVVEKQPEPPPAVKYLLIVGTYTTRANAEAFLQTLKPKKLKAEIIESTNKDGVKVYQVHLPDYKTTDASLEKVLELQKTTAIPDAWYKKENE